MKYFKIIIVLVFVGYLIISNNMKKYNIKFYKGEPITDKSSKEDIKKLQSKINEFFITREYTDRLKIDGKYGRKTKDAVILLNGSEPTSIEQIQEYVNDY